MNPREGKEALSYLGFHDLCKAFMKMKPEGKFCRWNETIFANLYLRLQFSTIGRTDNIGALLVSNFEWDCDALTLQFLTTKSDKGGERTNERKHIYASVDNPHICTILALAIYLWCKHLDDARRSTRRIRHT